LISSVRPIISPFVAVSRQRSAFYSLMTIVVMW